MNLNSLTPDLKRCKLSLICSTRRMHWRFCSSYWWIRQWSEPSMLGGRSCQPSRKIVSCLNFLTPQFLYKSVKAAEENNKLKKCLGHISRHEQFMWDMWQWVGMFLPPVLICFSFPLRVLVFSLQTHKPRFLTPPMSEQELMTIQRFDSEFQNQWSSGSKLMTVEHRGRMNDWFSNSFVEYLVS